MGLLRRLFFSANDLPALRKAMAQQRYADARLIVDDLLSSELSTEEQHEVQSCAAEAGNALAQRNLDEGLFLLRDDQLDRAADQLQLAREQAVSSELIQQIEEALSQSEQPQAMPLPSANSCSSCTAAPTSTIDQQDEELPDFDTQLELILMRYPTETAQRYQQKSSEFLHAFILGQQGDDLEALKQFGQLPAQEQDDLFDFEVGSLMARLGEPEKACDALYSALQKNPKLMLAAETLVTILLAMKKHEMAINFIKELLGKKQDSAFCHAQLASIYHMLDNAEAALNHGRQAVTAGNTDPRIILMTAMLLESNNELEQAEDLYRRIPAGGCGGTGINLYLAEFLLRQKRELRKILDTFNAACRQEPDNPRWQLRVAQTYLALGWDKRGQELLNTVVNDPRLMDELRHEAKTMLAG